MYCSVLCTTEQEISTRCVVFKVLTVSNIKILCLDYRNKKYEATCVSI